MPTPAAKPSKIEAAFFDVDNTIVRGSSSFLFGKAAYLNGFFKRSDFWNFAWHQFRYIAKGENNQRDRKLNDRALELVAGKKVEDMTALADEVYEKHIARRLWPQTVRIAQEHIKAGREVWLVTAAPIEIAELLAKRLGLTGGIGTVVGRKDGVFDGTLVGAPMHGKAKAKAVKRLAKERHMSLKRSFAYSDSRNDLPMLSTVGHAFAVNPDIVLRTHADAAGWPILDFKRSELKISKRAAKAQFDIKVPKVRRKKKPE